MKINEQLAEKPDHGHYLTCGVRKKEIEKLSKIIFTFVLIESAFILISTFIGINLGAISFIPSLIGEPSDIGYMAFQLLEMVALIVVAFLGTQKYKICGTVVFIIHCIIFIFALFGGLKRIFSIGSLIGAVGSLVSIKSVGDYFDYKQLENTEGFPSFSIFLADADDNPEYKSYFYGRNAAADEDCGMAEPVAVEQPKSNSKKSYMDEV